MDQIKNILGVVVDLDLAIDCMHDDVLCAINQMPETVWQNGDTQAWFTCYEVEHHNRYGVWCVSLPVPDYTQVANVSAADAI